MKEDIQQQLRPVAPDERVAVTITTKNRPTYLAALLTSLSQQTYTNWQLVINDQSDMPVNENDTNKDLLTLIEAQGHGIQIIQTKNPCDRYQRVLEAVPAGIEFVHRIDDDVVLSPTYLEKILRPFVYFADRPLAAVGGCLPGPHMRPLSLGKALAQPGWFPRIDKPTWQLQGHGYEEHEIVEMESLWGCAMLYRRSAVMAVGGWTVPGQSQQIFREDSDMSARLVVAGYELMMTTEALGWHLVAPSGGAREVRKTTQGNVYASHREEYDADDRLFRERIEQFLSTGYRRETFLRYRIADLEQQRQQPRPLVNRLDKVYEVIVAALSPFVRRTLRRLVGR